MKSASRLTVLALLLVACPGDEGVGSSGASTTSNNGTMGTTTSSGSTPADSTTLEAITSSGSTSTPATSGTSTGGAMLACDEATTAEECARAGSVDTDCGWHDTEHIEQMGQMCNVVATGGVCLTTTVGDETCGLSRDPSCGPGDDRVVFVRPSSEVDGATETLVIANTGAACSGPDMGGSWEVCVEGGMTMGCRCGCA